MHSTEYHVAESTGRGFARSRPSPPSTFRQWNPTFLGLRYPKELRIGVQPVVRSGSARTIFSFLSLSYWRTLAINKEQASSIRRGGSDGKHCFENITIPIKRARSGGRVANTRIYQNLRNISPKQNRRKSLAA